MTCYASTNFKTKKALKDAVDGLIKIRVRELTPMGDRVPVDGRHALCGPWYPESHKWYADCEVTGGVIIRVVK